MSLYIGMWNHIPIFWFLCLCKFSLFLLIVDQKKYKTWSMLFLFHLFLGFCGYLFWPFLGRDLWNLICDYSQKSNIHKNTIAKILKILHYSQKYKNQNNKLVVCSETQNYCTKLEIILSYMSSLFFSFLLTIKRKVKKNY